MIKSICFDMDGTFADLYSVENWLPMLRAEDTTPYAEAKPLVNLSLFARLLNQKQKQGYTINIISWTSKTSSRKYHKAVAEAKIAWLKKHLPSVHWDNIHIIEYGTAKELFGYGILFDDESANRTNWEKLNGNTAYDVDNMLEILKQL